MATYRVFFRNEARVIVGRDDFDADDDASAMAIAYMLADACGDRCAAFELWQKTRRVDTCFAKSVTPSADEIAERVIDRELAISASQWAIANSLRLLEQTKRLIMSARGHVN
jgi:hypothetical protein